MLPPARNKADLIRARLMLIRQLKACGGVWSDGRTIYRGAELETLIRQTALSLVDLRAGTRQRRTMDLMVNNVIKSGVLKRAPDESHADWFARLVKTSGPRPMDPGSRDRGIFARRMLRRHFPDRLADLALDIRHSEKERGFVVAAQESRPMMLKRAAHIFLPGFQKPFILPAGTRVSLSGGHYYALVSGQAMILTQGEITRVRKRHLRPNGKLARAAEAINATLREAGLINT